MDPELFLEQRQTGSGSNERTVHRQCRNSTAGREGSRDVRVDFLLCSTVGTWIVKAEGSFLRSMEKCLETVCG